MSSYLTDLIYIFIKISVNFFAPAGEPPVASKLTHDHTTPRVIASDSEAISTLTFICHSGAERSGVIESRR